MGYWKVDQMYTSCLAEAAYYIESDGEAIIIDPLRETKPYLYKLNESGATLKYILETHFHADFVSGHIDLAKETGATIVYGPNAKSKVRYDIYEATDGELLNLGCITIKVLHTPGHTMESTTYLLIDENGIETAIFSGDTLFLGDVGRPDLAIKSDLTREDLAGKLFDSLRTKILTLDDSITVYPGHGAGSACGKSMSKETIGNLGEQKQSNYALRADMSREEFIKELTSGLSSPPQYFSKNAMLNINGYDSFSQVLKTGNTALSVDDFINLKDHGSLVLDVRSSEEFLQEHIPGSIFIGLDGQFAPWVGALITDINQSIIIVAPEGREEETVTRLARIGYDNSVGYLLGGIDAWKEYGHQVDSINSISAETFFKDYNSEKLPIVDVRKVGEFQSEHLEGAISLPLDNINATMNQFPNSSNFYIHCLGGYRSVIAASILSSRGIKNLIDVKGGFRAMKNAGAETTEYTCSSQS